MALSDSMNTSIQGIKSQSNAMSTVADNIANMRTVSYKEVRNKFSTLVTSSKMYGGYQAGGVKNAVSRMTDQAGALESSNSQTALGIQGNGMFVVGTTAAPTSTKMFSRAGDFSPDAQGYLKNTAGSFLYGWAIDSSGNRVTNTGTTDDLVPIKLEEWTSAAVSTQNVSLGLNLSSQAELGATYSVTQTVYDSLGAPHDLLMTFTKSSESPLIWNLAVTSDDGGVLRNDTSTVYSGVPITFDTKGRPTSFSSSTNGQGIVTTSDTLPQLSIAWDSDPAKVNTSTITLNLGQVNSLTGVTSVAGPSNVLNRSHDGTPAGQLVAYNIDATGVMRAFFDNQNSMPVYQIPLATFANPRGLTAVSGNNFMSSPSSGNYELQTAQSSGAGAILAGNLEASTVDVTTEFSEMVSTQQAFSANVQAFQAEDEMYRVLERIRS